ncbi:MAG: hypothetical protein HXN39_00900 [Prevotella histicola]|nr:hypothetical protein [Prevotella histicola]
MLLKTTLRKKILLTAMALTAVVPSVAKALLLSAAPTAEGENQQVKTGVYYIVNDKRQSGTDLCVYADTDGSLRGTMSPAPYSDLFILHSKGGEYYTIQSLKDGKYIQNVSGNYQAYKAGNGAHKFQIVYQTKSAGTGKSYFNIYNNRSDGDWCWHLDGQKKVVRWYPLSNNGISALGPSEFRLEPVTSLTQEQVLERLAQLTKVVNPTKDLNKYYQIVSEAYGRSIREDYIVGELSTGSYNDTDYSYCWKLVKLNSGRYAFQNAVTGKYIVPQNGATSRYYTTSDAQGSGFDLKFNSNDPYELAFEMLDNGNVGIHCAESQGYHPVGWYNNNDANKWLFKEATINAAKLKEQQNAYKARVALTNNVSKYADAIAKYFTNSAATEVTAQVKGMRDEKLKAKMAADGLPEGLQKIVLKIKNQSWKSYASGRNWEKKFRIADYKAYSENNYDAWARSMGIGYDYGSMTNPTGITVRDGEDLFVFLGDDILPTASVQIELVPLGTRSAGKYYTLKKGLNIILNQGENNVFVNYIGRTYNNGKLLKDYKPINIHIEGGDVNGYFDLTKGDTNEDWQTMQSDKLVWAKAFNIKGDLIVMHMPSDACKQYTPVHMKELVEIWNSIVQREDDLMGFRAGVKDKCNNVLNATAVDHGYMYATTGGTYYNYSTLGDVLNYDKMKMGNGTLWGPAHEFGHNHQQLFNTAGMTEISVNMYSNMVMFTSGRVTSRSENCSYTDVDGKKYDGVCESAVSTYADRFANKKMWFEYGTWGTTQMYYKLYMMFHSTGLDDQFWHKCLDYLRTHRLEGQGTANCQGQNDYLLFAKACCVAANQDLSSFFEAWGHFYDVNGSVIGDYSNTTMYTTRAQWMEVKKFMKQFPKGPANNMIFIDDHIRRTPATYPGHAAGEMREDFNGAVRVGRMGDFGSWDQFCPDSLGQGYAIIKTQSDANGRRTYTMEAKNSHVVGFKIYNSKGQLIYFANTKTFTIPKKVMGDAGNNIVVKVCGSDGSEVDPGVNPTGIKTFTVQANDGKVDVYSIYGVLVRSKVNAATALEGLPNGVYVVGGKKVVVGK